MRIQEKVLPGLAERRATYTAILHEEPVNTVIYAVCCITQPYYRHQTSAVL